MDDDETSQAVESDATLFVTPTGFVTTSFGGETALSLTRQLANQVLTPSSLSADDVRSRIRSTLVIEEWRGTALVAAVRATIRKPGYRAEQFELTSDREIRTPGWLLDAIHERILPLKGYQARTNQTLGEMVRRSRLGV